MASVDKASLREEFDTLKDRFDQLITEGKISAESRALFQAMLMLFQVLMAVFMEKRTAKNSLNASLPSSQTAKADDTASKPGTKGKGKSHRDAACANSRTKVTTRVAKVRHCMHCGEDLSDTPCQDTERRSRIDILFEKVVEHVDAEIKTCPCCQRQTKGQFPTTMPGPLQCGTGIKAYALNLVIAQMLSLKRVQQAIRTLIGETLSEATLLKFILQLHKALADWERWAIEQLLAMPAIHVDETSLRVERQNRWIHVYSGGDITCKRLHSKRGKAAIEDINIIPRYGGVTIHDCWASYLSYDHCGHGLCGAHLLRELAFVIDAHGYRWAQNMKRLLQETCAAVTGRKNKKLNKREYKNLQKRYRNILTRGEKELPPIPPKQNGKRGRVAKSDAHNLLERMQRYEEAILLFARESHVAFTNNRAERDLRMSKVKQKVSGCFRSARYAEAYCRISSYLQSMENLGYNPLVAIQMALAGEIPFGGGE